MHKGLEGWESSQLDTFLGAQCEGCLWHLRKLKVIKVKIKKGYSYVILRR